MAGKEYWLNRERLVLYRRAMLLVLLIIFVKLLLSDLLEPPSHLLGSDFNAFWAASRLGLYGHPEDAYQAHLLVEVEKISHPAMAGVLPWFYPPSFYLLILPFGLLPYLAAYGAFVLSTLAAYVAAFVAQARRREALWYLVTFPAVWINLVHGQNAFLTSALAAVALASLQRRPVLSGVLIGLLSIKPHLAVLFPLALVTVGAWRTLWTALLVALALAAGATAVLGSATWPAFISSLSLARWGVETGAVSWATMPTVFSLCRLLGVVAPLAYLLHGLVAGTAIWSVWRVWRRTASMPVRGAALMCGTFLVSPYLFAYDLAGMAFPMLWLAQLGIRQGWLRGEREVLVAAWAMPLFMIGLALFLSIQIAPLVLIAFQWAVFRRATVLKGA